MISCISADDTTLSGSEAGHPQRHLVRLGTAATQNDTLDLRTVQRGEAFGEFDDTFVQVAAVDVQRGLLARHRLDHTRIRVTDARHVVVHVHVAAAVVIVHVNVGPADDMQRNIVKQWCARSQGGIAPSEQIDRVVHPCLPCDPRRKFNQSARVLIIGPSAPPRTTRWRHDELGRATRQTHPSFVIVAVVAMALTLQP